MSGGGSVYKLLVESDREFLATCCVDGGGDGAEDPFRRFDQAVCQLLDGLGGGLALGRGGGSVEAVRSA